MAEGVVHPSNALLCFVLEHGADLTAKNNGGHTTLSLAYGLGNKAGAYQPNNNNISRPGGQEGLGRNISHSSPSPPSRHSSASLVYPLRAWKTPISRFKRRQSAELKLH